MNEKFGKLKLLYYYKDICDYARQVNLLQLQVDFSLLNKFFGIPMTRLAQYGNKDLEQIMEMEAAQGNQKAAEYKKILSDPDKIQDIFKLANFQNKFLILHSAN